MEASAEADVHPLGGGRRWREAKRAKRPPYTPEQEAAARAAEASAAAEGLKLIPSSTSTSGYKYIYLAKNGKYALQVDGQYLGYYSTAEEAALAYSRSIGKDAAHLEAAEARPPRRAS